MRKTLRSTPIGKQESFTIKNFSFNDKGLFFIIYTNESLDKEQIIGFNEVEFKRLKQFMEKIK